MSQTQINKIQEILEIKLNPQVLEIIDESDEHLGHQEADQGMHLKIKLVDEQFDKLNLVQRHKLIYQTLGDLSKLHIHALALQVLSPNEYRKSNS